MEDSLEYHKLMVYIKSVAKCEDIPETAVINRVLNKMGAEVEDSDMAEHVLLGRSKVSKKNCHVISVDRMNSDIVDEYAVMAIDQFDPQRMVRAKMTIIAQMSDVQYRDILSRNSAVLVSGKNIDYGAFQ